MLENNLHRLEVEIDFYKNQVGLSIWEIGKRLNYVKEHRLVRGEFKDWLRKREIEYSAAVRMMKIARELPNVATLPHLGITALYLIASLPKEKRDDTFLTEEGEEKQPHEMTVKELRALNSAINQPEPKPPQEKKLATNDEQTGQFIQQIKTLKEELSETQASLSAINKKYQQVVSQPVTHEKAVNMNILENDIKKLSKQKEKYISEMDSLKNILQLKEKVSLLLSQISPILYIADTEAIESDPIVKNHFISLIDLVQKWCDDMNRKFNQPLIITAQIIEDDNT